MARRYTIEQKAQTLILLAANRGNTILTASQTGVAESVIKNWARQESALPSPDIGKGMEQAINYLMGQIPNLVNKYNIAELLGTLLEKWLHYQGIPQNSTQTILAVLATKSEEDLDRMIVDIDQGKELRLNHRQTIIDVEEEMANVGLMGLAERGQGDPELIPLRPSGDGGNITDLINYNEGEATDDTW